MDLSETCVVHLIEAGEEEHDCADHQIEGYHEADGAPTSERCPGIAECADCIDVIDSIVESLGPGIHIALTHEVLVAQDGTWSVVAKSDLA